MKRKYYKISGHDNLRRDAESMGIVNIDRDALNKHREEREFKKKVTQIVDEHEELKKLVSTYGENIAEMKEILKQMLRKL